jgi:hypothetical protein
MLYHEEAPKRRKQFLEAKASVIQLRRTLAAADDLKPIAGYRFEKTP